MVNYKPEDGKWCILPTAKNIKNVRESMGEEIYKQNCENLKLFLCDYFSVGNCASKQGKSIALVGSTPSGGKLLKVRWGVPGKGKSSSLRLSVVVYCDKKQVSIAEAFWRNEDPSDQEFFSSVSEA